MGSGVSRMPKTKTSRGGHTTLAWGADGNRRQGSNNTNEVRSVKSSLGKKVRRDPTKFVIRLHLEPGDKVVESSLKVELSTRSIKVTFETQPNGAFNHTQKYIWSAIFCDDVKQEYSYDFCDKCIKLTLRKKEARPWHWYYRVPETIEQHRDENFSDRDDEGVRTDESEEDDDSWRKKEAKRIAMTDVRDVVLGHTGLLNLGNTCFMNSVLQVLANCTDLRIYFTPAGEYMEDINEANRLGHGGKLAKCFASLLGDLWSGKPYISPHNLKDLVGKKVDQFSGYSQQDAQEFMTFLLDGLHEDVNKVKKKPNARSIASNGRKDKDVADESWSTYKGRHNSKIVDLFHGQLKSVLTCNDCGKDCVTFDPLMYLALPLPPRPEAPVVSQPRRQSPLQPMDQSPSLPMGPNSLQSMGPSILPPISQNRSRSYDNEEPSSALPGPNYRPSYNGHDRGHCATAQGNLQAKEKILLYDCLKLFAKEEHLSDGERWYCPTCKDLKGGRKKMEVWRLPQYLVIQLKRFSYASFVTRDKLDDFVEYPTEGLDLSLVMNENSRDGSPLYDLCGVVCHNGDIGSGHYTAVARSLPEDRGAWRLYNDTFVKGTRDVVSKDAYLLVYRSTRAESSPIHRYVGIEKKETKGQKRKQDAGSSPPPSSNIQLITPLPHSSDKPCPMAPCSDTELDALD